jgi:HlyD family secretion protein
LQPIVQTDVSSELSGVVRSVDVTENQTVTKGQVLATLDTTRIAAQVERAEASVKAAAAKVSDANTTLRETENALERATSLSDRKLVATQALEGATAARDRGQSALQTAEANLAIAQADLKLQQADLAKSTIYAPIDGVVLTRSSTPARQSLPRSQRRCCLSSPPTCPRWSCRPPIDEADIGTVQKGQNAQFTVDAFPGRTFDATIRDIAYASVTTENVVTYEAKLTVDNRELLLRPGMTATVGCHQRGEERAVGAQRSVPVPPPVAERSQGFSLQSLFMPRMGRRNRGPAESQAADGSRTLYVLRGKQPEAVRVRTGVTDGLHTKSCPA